MSEEEKITEQLKLRASTLARPRTPVAEAAPGLTVLEFVLARERYAIEAAYVREVTVLKQLTIVPCTPHFVLGIINLDGKVLSVIDMKKLFDLPEKGLPELCRVVVIQNDEMEFGLLADSVTGFRSISEEEIEPGLPTLTGIRQEYLKGVTGDRTAILDGARLLSDRSLIVHEEVL